MKSCVDTPPSLVIMNLHSRTKSDLLKELVTLDAILWSCTLICKLLIDNVSRQMANLTYVIWIVSAFFPIFLTVIYSDKS